MYQELCEVWKRELENVDLEKLPPDFYIRVADYSRKLREETRMLDKRTLKATLFRKEMHNVKRMVHELIQTRCQKMINKLTRCEEIPHDVLTAEEEEVYMRISPFAETMWNLATEILRGHPPKVSVEQEHKRTTLRFLKDVPAIIGADLKTYGPFKAEDVASLPIENAKMLVRQSLAERVEVA
jgi:DNA replication factor GINS